MVARQPPRIGESTSTTALANSGQRAAAIRLTPAGERFRTHVQEVRRSVRAAVGSVGEFRETLSGTVEFGSLISFGPLNVARALGDFHRLHPYVRLRLRLSQSGASAYLAALIEGSLDLALVSVPDRFPPQLDMRLLFEESMVFVCCRDHPMARRKTVHIGSSPGTWCMTSSCDSSR